MTEDELGSRKRARVKTSRVTLVDFASLHEPHPYGVLPEGNRFLAETTCSQNKSAISLLTDECWNNVLSFCDGVELGKVCQVSRFFYVAAHQPELWRDLVLQKLGRGTIKKVGPTWKDTYGMIFAEQRCVPHKPIPMCNVYSDYYYRLHSCRAFGLPKPWLEESEESDTDVSRTPVEKMTVDLFLEKFERPNEPVVIEGACKSWRAFSKWKDLTYLEHQTKGRSFRATSGVAQQPAQFLFSAYMDYCTKSSVLEEGPLYLFDRTALTPGSTLWQDYMMDLKQTCQYWDPDLRDGNVGHDLFGILGEGRRPDHTWLIVGPRRSGSVFHIDPNATHAWNATICGRKRWIFYPPGITPPGVHPSDDGDEVALPLSIGEWIFQFWDEHCHRKMTSPQRDRPLEFTAYPGDVVFVPHGWWHAVINLDEVNIAITHNYVSFSNLSNVLKFLDRNQDQISGCRDRDESIKPEELYETFVRELKKEHSQEMERALELPEWTCRAWKKTTARQDEVTPTKRIIQNTASIMETAKSGNEGWSFGFSLM